MSLIKLIVFNGYAPLWTSANATRKGARPNPATQWTAMRFSTYLDDELAADLLTNFDWLPDRLDVSFLSSIIYDAAAD